VRIRLLFLEIRSRIYGMHVFGILEDEPPSGSGCHESSLKAGSHGFERVGVSWVSGIAHLRLSLGAELAQQGTPVGVHCLSPGMVLTKLLEGASEINKQV
jgi:hypothetical protein